MFGLMKRKPREIYAPIDGKVIPIEEVDDEVFAGKLAGDGVAILPIGDTFCAPIEGVVTKIFPTNHAYIIKSDKDLEVMVHIGLESMALEGRGFERLVEEGADIKAGDPVIKVDMAYLAQHAKDTVTPIVVTEESKMKELEKKTTVVKQGDAIMRAL